MSILIKGMEMPLQCIACEFWMLYPYKEETLDMCKLQSKVVEPYKKDEDCPLIEVPPHGDLIDRDALMKDGWLNLHKEVMRMGGYAIHELPLKNPSIPVVIEKENC